jgi:LuxR family maltose regulon positive regulatory protein
VSQTVDRTAPQSRPLLMTKLHPPPPRDQTVPRDRLLERLHTGPGTKLTLVAAPAGSGKTTLLGMWREAEEAASRPVAWLTLDEGDNDPVVLWSYVIAALRGACPELDMPLSPELVGPSRIVNGALPELVNALTAVGEVSLVLDDFHRVSSGSVRESVAWFVDHVPSTFRLVLATRSEPALPLGALRAHGALLELRADELGFTPAEAGMLLNDRLELGLESEYVDDLVDRTEGWPTGLYLAALSVRGAEDRRAFASTFGGGSRHVVDFLVDEVLEAHDPATQALMLRCSILERLSGPLCDAVLEQEGSGRLLSALSRTNLFLMPLDDRGEWYRFHHLFAQLVRVELEHREPGLTPTLHRRAYAWHRENGPVDAAIEHALAAGAFAEAGELIAAGWIHYVNLSRFSTVLAWLERFPQEVLRADAMLLVVKAWIHAICGEREASLEAVARVDQLDRVNGGPLPDGFSSLEASLVTLGALFPWGDTHAGLESARRAAELEGHGSAWRPAVCLALGAGLYYTGDFEEADGWLAESAELATTREQWLIAACALALGSLVAGELGRVDEQALLADQAMQLARERGAEEGEVFVAVGASLAARGKPDEALPPLERGLEVQRSRGHPRPLADVLMRHAAVLRALDQHEAAVEAIAEARVMVESCPDPGFLTARLEALEGPPRAVPRPRAARLSERELVILRMLRGSLSERDIGRELYLSHNTIHSHTRSIYRKLGVSSRAEALQRAVALGLL